jgi:hypothetical protein
MEIVVLPEKFIEQLAETPENGMGYQRVDITFTDETTAKDVIILSCQAAQMPDEHIGKQIQSITWVSGYTK